LSGTGDVGDTDHSVLANAKVLESFIEALDLQDITMVVHDVGGPIGFRVANSHPRSFRAFVISNTFCWPLRTYPMVRRILTWVGSPLFAAVNQNTNLLIRFTATSHGVGRRLTKSERAVFKGPWRSRPARRATQQVLAGAGHVDPLMAQLERALATTFVDLPVLTLFGRKNDPYGWQKRFGRIFRNSTAAGIGDGNHFPFSDDPDGYSDAITDWWARKVALPNDPPMTATNGFKENTMNTKPKASTALITGASRGIGPHIATALARRGMNLVLTGRSVQELEAVAAEQRKHGVRVLAVASDLLDADARELLIGAAEREFGGVDVLVNNAGGDPLHQFHEMSIQENEAILKLNLFAPIALTHLVLPGMLKRGHGHIVNISSMAGRISFPYTEAYAAAKDGVIGFSRVLRSDYRRSGVSASVLILGAIRGAGQGQRTLDEMQRPSGAYMAPVEAVAKAVVRAIDKDKAEIVVMPGPARLLRALLDFFPGMGPWMNQQMGVNRTMREVQEFKAGQKPVSLMTGDRAA
jgi:short-subunit dehydrogenase/pimeloyl-ACP methyl ester carboxylesterase